MSNDEINVKKILEELAADPEKAAKVGSALMDSIRRHVLPPFMALAKKITLANVKYDYNDILNRWRDELIDSDTSPRLVDLREKHNRTSLPPGIHLYTADPEGLPENDIVIAVSESGEIASLVRDPETEGNTLVAWFGEHEPGILYCLFRPIPGLKEMVMEASEKLATHITAYEEFLGVEGSAPNFKAYSLETVYGGESENSLLDKMTDVDLTKIKKLWNEIRVVTRKIGKMVVHHYLPAGGIHTRISSEGSRKRIEAKRYRHGLIRRGLSFRLPKKR